VRPGRDIKVGMNATSFLNFLDMPKVFLHLPENGLVGAEV
jgi:hypothetical protein